MKLSLLTASVAALFVTSLAFADSSNNCAVIGIKNSKQFFRANQRSCFANISKAGKKGFVNSASATAIRGFSVTLTGETEVPPVTTAATGSCIAALLTDKTTLKVSCSHTVTSPTGAHLHQGAVGVDGSIICDLGTATSPIIASCTLSTDQVTALLTGLTYVNVHSTDNSGGEIRGQLN